MSANQSSSGTTKRNKKNQLKDDDNVEKLTKEETQIARYLRLSGPKKQGSLLGMKVDFFLANKLIDFLMDSKWGPGLSSSSTAQQPKAGKPPLLANRQACVAFVQRLMNKQLFYRAIKIYKEEKEPVAAAVSGSAESSEQTATPSAKKRSKAATTTTTTGSESGQTSTPSTEKLKKDKESSSSSTSKKKFKLEMHEEQRFMDAAEPYVWVYDPTSTKTYIIGSLLILGAIGICLFPLWPSQVREGVYYLSLAGASFLGAILGLAIFKYVLFAVIWACTFGSVHFWLFPNLTEDVGFFESFQPVYKCNCSSKSAKTTEDDDSLKKKKKDDDFEVEKKTSIPAEDEAINDVANVEEEDVTTTTNKSDNLAKSALTLETSSTELSQSTVEISKLVSGSASGTNTPTALKRRKSSTNKEDDGFELVDDEDLNNK